MLALARGCSVCQAVFQCQPCSFVYSPAPLKAHPTLQDQHVSAILLPLLHHATNLGEAGRCMLRVAEKHAALYAGHTALGAIHSPMQRACIHARNLCSITRCSAAHNLPPTRPPCRELRERASD